MIARTSTELFHSLAACGHNAVYMYARTSNVYISQQLCVIALSRHTHPYVFPAEVLNAKCGHAHSKWSHAFL